MPPASKIDLLDEATRRELDQRIIANGFGGYEALSEWLSERGFSIGKSALGAYGKDKLKRRLAAVKASTEAARMIASAAPDDADERSAAIISLVQTEIFEVLLNLQEAEEIDDPVGRVEVLGKAAKHIATLTRASVARNKHAIEVREKALLEAAERVESAAQARGLSANDARFWRDQVLAGM